MQMNDTPSPEAIVQAALERAAEKVGEWFSDPDAPIFQSEILALASNPSEVAAIIKKAGEDQG